MKYNKLVDHTLLAPQATVHDIDKLIDEAIKYDFKSVCIAPTWIKHAKEKLAKSDVLVCTVIGFPLGSNATSVKVYETKIAIAHGADEIDMVINIGRFKNKEYEFVLNEIKAIKEECGSKTLKVIVETALLTNEEIAKVTEIVMQSGAEFIKTSTGFSYRGASFEDVEIMKRVAQDKLLIKASGGIKVGDDAIKMVELGANRLGMSKSIQIMEDLEKK
ncbi:Deoxyribose-phosphate aldolase [Metamycoplasma arthritidis]|uniref:Deoxyribose-phosphate aldolase n=1 Tax=Metamycoplasma arthritidis (strain 158L3-1) TaxID=243272 RepID=DEOC_META1|nr:deoxyribose-phosphate aldolase [Metamycoplasma arthritidis]B3PM95.1 RecName: Full=Deoxyribose-phosphate aldolase; Short=DERA; AltName: Full=2-deoxy-D-ribose 5-phosphate aldolase; AltName: Full=Phosphodeoxyriboaldolase; Short=Deoxyriboaldolase [Metamycoplasma arthritidis 158L3-1]ACF07147.1 deoxyribose-phosphate aldolase [Metamycoplasma arthritidis 158L3-1]VEU78672.1 Deoxyribose-phosphate aldolase [Metamycoplasma arthritidis]